jgi:outer membrane protein assembly factor BamE (lipoprotein component of BamABCDE complex)
MRYFSIVCMLLLAGCVSSGTQVTEQQAAQFQKGVTTEAQVTAKLGAPDSTTRNDDGSRIDSYTYISASANAVDFIPYVGLLAGGSTGKYTTVAFIFDSAGVLKGYTSTSGKSDVNTGLLNQK